MSENLHLCLFVGYVVMMVVTAYLLRPKQLTNSAISTLGDGGLCCLGAIFWFIALPLWVAIKIAQKEVEEE